MGRFFKDALICLSAMCIIVVGGAFVVLAFGIIGVNQSIISDESLAWFSFFGIFTICLVSVLFVVAIAFFGFGVWFLFQGIAY